MKHYLLLILVCLNSGILFSQSRSIRVTAGEDAAQAYSSNGFYRFAQFSNAILYFKGGSKNKGTLFNYNILTGNLQFISPKGDTLDMANNSAVDSVVFDNSTFLYNDGFIEVVAKSDSLKLIKKIVLKTQVENIGAYGVPTATASIVNMRTLSSGNGFFNLVLNQNIVIVETISWFLGNGSNNIIKATKDNFLKLLPAEKQAKAAAYLKLNKTSFDKENDLKKLMAAIES